MYKWKLHKKNILNKNASESRWFWLNYLNFVHATTLKKKKEAFIAAFFALNFY
jgi:hypothetical protein